MDKISTENYPDHILVVDDTPANLRLLVHILREKGYQVRAVPNGELALSAAQGLPPDLILLDIMMPKMDGYEVCQRLKENELTKDIPIIFISAVYEMLDKTKAFAVGGVDFISKPFQIEEVLARIENQLKICYLQNSLKSKNEELAKIKEQLKETQNQLVQLQKQIS